MFDSLSAGISGALKRLVGTGRLTQENIEETLQQKVRVALLEADVALPVVKEFIGRIREKAVGAEVLKSLTPADTLVKIVHDELVTLLGGEFSEINLRTQPPAVVLMAGLQGSGKTTTTAKLAHWLKIRQNKKVLVVSTDIYRPAAIDQLKTLAGQVDVNYFPSDASQSPVDIAHAAIQAAKVQFMDVVIIDTAGRLHIDEEMMQEIRQLSQATSPIETLFVVDSMTGQDAANTAKTFNDALDLTGIILTKTDGDARGGAALSMRSITGKPIKFIGVGEKNDALEAFHPDRMASRILGMGDVLSLVEEVQRKIDHTKAEKLTKKMAKGKAFDLEDFKEQLQQMLSMGGVSGLMGKLPGMAQIPTQLLQSKMDDKTLIRMIAIINSMTPKERRYPDTVKNSGSRKSRIAKGSGTNIPEINSTIKQAQKMADMMKKFSGAGMMKMMQKLGKMKGMFPGGFPGV